MDIREVEYFRNVLRDTIKVDAIYTIHYFRYGKGFSFPLERHPFWEMVFVDSGELTVTADNKSFVMKQGEACFHAPNVPHTVKTKNSFANSVIVSFEASGKYAGLLSDKIFKFEDDEKKLLAAIVNECKKSYSGRMDDAVQTKMERLEDAPFGADQIIKNSIELLLVYAIRKNFENLTVTTANSATSSVHAEKIVQEIKKILAADLSASISLDELSKQLFFSKTYIKSTFKRITGTTIIKYYNSLKIDEAKRLISLNEHTITEITKLLGFSSVNYFSRLFKKTTDMTPSEYYRSIKADNVLI